MTLDAKIEAILFFKGEPIAISKLAEFANESEDDVRGALDILREKLEYRGLSLVETEDVVMLGTKPEATEIIEKLQKDELSRELGRAGLETLAIILYKGPLARQEIDYIRGVNSSFIVRNLLVRGLIERIQNEQNARSFLYRPTIELFSFLGISQMEDLPEFDTLREKIDSFVAQEKLDDEELTEVGADHAQTVA